MYQFIYILIGIASQAYSCNSAAPDDTDLSRRGGLSVDISGLSRGSGTAAVIDIFAVYGNISGIRLKAFDAESEAK